MLKYDIAVIGAGPAGVAAAVSAARRGARVLLVEESGALGGMSTSGLLNIWCGSVRSAFWEEIKQKTTVQRGNRVIYSPEMLKSVLIDTVCAAGVELLLHATVSALCAENGGVTSLTLLAAGNTLSLQAGIVIDATGDGDVALMAGAAFAQGRPSDGLTQPMSLMFLVGGVDERTAVYPTFGTHPQLERKLAEYLADGRLPFPIGHVITVEGYDPGTASVNMTNVVMHDGTDPRSLTDAELAARRQIPRILDFLRHEVPGYASCYLIASAEHIGVRESRRFLGQYTLTEQDILAERVFDDWIVREVRSCFGNHNLTGGGADPCNLEWHGEQYTIPYRCFVAKDFSNLLLCGRNISGTHMAHASYRVMPICFAMGEGLGRCAAAAAAAGISPAELSLSAIREIQREL